MINIKNTITVLFFCAFAMQAWADADRPDTANPFFEINRVMGTMATGNHISFNTIYYYEDSDSAGITRDTISGIYKINGQNYYATMDSTVVIQNNFYNVTIDKKDSSIIIASPKTIFTTVMTNDILNPVLQSSYVSKILLTDSATTRKLSFVFNDISPYSTYEFLYDTVSYNMISVKYILKHYGPTAGVGSYYTQIRVVFNTYQTNVFTDDVFDTSSYLARVNGVFTGVLSYSGYTIFNQVMNQ